MACRGLVRKFRIFRPHNHNSTQENACLFLYLERNRKVLLRLLCAHSGWCAGLLAEGFRMQQEDCETCGHFSEKHEDCEVHLGSSWLNENSICLSMIAIATTETFSFL